MSDHDQDSQDMSADDSQGLSALVRKVQALKDALLGVVVGQEGVIHQLLAALLTGGHVLLEGNPGVAKTLLARTLSNALGLEFRRIQFTPDLMPADIVGTNVFDFQQGQFHLQKGPVFTNLLMADEINRTPPKTQAALLESMEEHQVTIDGVSHPLADPFLVIATQNPLEHEGTYPLPEAQLDRFLMKIRMGYPSPEAETEIYRRYADGRLHLAAQDTDIPAVLAPGDLIVFRKALGGIHVEDKILGYLRDFVGLTRSSEDLSLGASPRAGMSVLAAARAHAAMEGRAFVIPDDIKTMALPVLRHRLLPTAEAELEGLGAEQITSKLLDSVEVPR